MPEWDTFFQYLSFLSEFLDPEPPIHHHPAYHNPNSGLSRLKPQRVENLPTPPTRQREKNSAFRAFFAAIDPCPSRDTHTGRQPAALSAAVRTQDPWIPGRAGTVRHRLQLQLQLRTCVRPDVLFCRSRVRECRSLTNLPAYIRLEV